MNAAKSMVLAAAILAGSPLPLVAYDPLTIKKGDPPLVVAEAHPDINGDGKPDTVTIALVEGRRYNDENGGCSGGWKDEGNFVLTVSISGGRTRVYSANDLPLEITGFSGPKGSAYLMFFRPDPWSIRFADVTHDGRLTFTLGQYGACRGWEYAIFAIDNAGGVSFLPLPNGAIAWASHDEASPRLTLTPRGFICGDKPVHAETAEDDERGERVDLECTWDASKGRFDIAEYRPPAITVANHSRWDVCYVLLSPPSAKGWGSNRLPPGVRIGTEQEWEFQVPEATMDVMVASCDGTPLEMYRGYQDHRLSIGFDGTPEMQPNSPGIEVINSTDTSVCWDRGGKWVVGPNARRILFDIRPEWHGLIRFYACDGSVLETPRWIESRWTFVIGTGSWPPEKAVPPAKEMVVKSQVVAKFPTPPPKF